MKNTMYRVMPEYYDFWGCYDEETATVSMDTIQELAIEWETPVDELMKQVEEI